MIGNTKPYPAMKESGIPWLGAVPKHWDVTRLKRVCRLAYGDALPTEMRENGVVPVFGSNGKVGVHESANTEPRCIVIGRKGSFGKVNFSQDPVFAIDTTFFIDRRFSTADLRWLFFVLRWLRLDQISKDSAVPGLDREDAYSRPIPLPPRAEQTAIARYLDHASRHSRRYIRAKQKLIMLLEEQSQSIIHEAVTGQIDVRTGRPYQAYRSAIIGWQSDVPSHWNVRPNGRLFAERNETGLTDLPILEVSLHTGVRVRDMARGMRKQQMADRSKYKHAAPGDLAYNMMRMWQGAVGVAPIAGLISPAYVVARPLPQVNQHYYSYLFRTNAYMQQVNSASRGIVSDRNRLYWDEFKQLPSPVPPAEEQRCIADFLDSHRRLTARLIRAERGLMALLEERNETVTHQVIAGHIDVRGAYANLHDAYSCDQDTGVVPVP